MKGYTIEDAQRICTKLYEPLRAIGVFIGVTGGSLYKEGPRKDIDLLVYLNTSHADIETTDIEDMPMRIIDVISKAADVNEYTTEYFGYVTKTFIDGIPVDILFPEYGPNRYPTEQLV